MTTTLDVYSIVLPDDPSLRPGPKIRYTEWIGIVDNHKELLKMGKKPLPLVRRKTAQANFDDLDLDDVELEPPPPPPPDMHAKAKVPLRRGRHPRVDILMAEPEPSRAPPSPPARQPTQVLMPDSYAVRQKQELLSLEAAKSKEPAKPRGLKQSRFVSHLQRNHSEREASAKATGRVQSGWQKARTIVRVQSAADTLQDPKQAGATPANNEIADAADAFEQRHRHRSAIAERAAFESDNPRLRVLNTSTQRAQREFPRTVKEVRRNRVIVPHHLVDVTTFDGSNTRHEIPFDVYKSIWRPRALWADSGDLFDSHDVRLTRFSTHWVGALRMGVASVIVHDEFSRQVGDPEVDGIPDEVEQTAEAFWKHDVLISSLFAHYASFNLRLDAMALDSWLSFVSECTLLDKNSKACKLSDLQHVFTQTTMVEADMGIGMMLSRAGFLVAIVRTAINKFIVAREMNNVADAVARLIAVYVGSKLGAQVTRDPDAFRRNYCYGKHVTAVLKRNEATLRTCYECVSRLSYDGEVKTSTQTLPLDQWLRAMRALGMMDVDLSERDALRCFSASRMVVGNHQSTRGRHEDTHLPFEGFLEALCRVAAQKALPTEEEIDEWARAAGPPTRPDAGEYMASLRTSRPKVANALLKSRKIDWCGAIPVQGFERRVEHTISLLGYAVKQLQMKAGRTWRMPLPEG